MHESDRGHVGGRDQRYQMYAYVWGTDIMVYSLDQIRSLCPYPKRRSKMYVPHCPIWLTMINSVIAFQLHQSSTHKINCNTQYNSLRPIDSRQDQVQDCITINIVIMNIKLSISISCAVSVSASLLRGSYPKYDGNVSSTAYLKELGGSSFVTASKSRNALTTAIPEHRHIIMQIMPRQLEIGSKGEWSEAYECNTCEGKDSSSG